MFHGFPVNTEMIALVFGLIVWIVRGIIKGVKQLKRQIGPASPLPQAPPPSQSAPPSQTLPARAPRLEPARTTARQPSAGGPAVTTETNRRDFQRQEQELEASEPAALNTSLLSGVSLPTSQPNKLFSGTDDLIRAIILQEVLGPPLSRRTHTPSNHQSNPQSPQ